MLSGLRILLIDRCCGASDGFVVSLCGSMQESCEKVLKNTSFLRWEKMCYEYYKETNKVSWSDKFKSKKVVDELFETINNMYSTEADRRRAWIYSYYCAIYEIAEKQLGPPNIKDR